MMMEESRNEERHPERLRDVMDDQAPLGPYQ